MKFTKDYSGMDVYVGIDVHKKSWEAHFVLDTINKKKVRFERPLVKNFVNYAKRKYPGANFICAYEAGFSGFWTKRSLEQHGFKVMVVNPADIPTSSKDRVYKSDSRDCRKIASALRSQELEAIHCPTVVEERDRALFRTRSQVAKMERKCKNKIKSLLLYLGIDIPEELETPNWSNKFKAWLKQISETHNLLSLQHQISTLEAVRVEHAKILKNLRVLSKTDRHKEICQILQSAPGVGKLTSIRFKLEIIDMHRFSNVDKLLSYLGLVPTTNHSGESNRIGKMTKRGRTELRRALIESAWVAIRYDDGLRTYYEECKRVKSANKAIVKVAVKLTKRLRYMWIHKVKYMASE